jgi:hypothetical protein
MNAKEQFEAFLEQQKDANYKLGDITGTPEGDMKKYTELKISATQEEEKRKYFFEKRQEAFEALAQRHNEEQIALGQLWQEAEEDNYTPL